MLMIEGKAKLPDLEWNEREKAKCIIRERLGNSLNIIESKPFLIVGPHNGKYLTALDQKVLQPYYSYFIDKLADEQDNSVLCAFVAPNHDQLAEMAIRLYGIKRETSRFALEHAIAFSDTDANVMMAICGRKAANCTSFAHELFHLLNAKTFDDAPWWLSEGMAELYESSEKKGTKIVGKVNWRKKDLEMERFQPADLRGLLELSKNDEGLYRPPGSLIAMARVRFFCQYLDELDKLWTVYGRLRMRPSQEVLIDPSGITVLEKEMGKSIEAIGDDFKSWMKKNVAPIRPSTTGP
jgi:hypothetical protein